MAVDKSRSFYNAIFVPADARIVSSDISASIQAGPNSGIPIPSGSVNLSLTSVGDQEEDITFRITDGGFPTLSYISTGSFGNTANLVHAGARGIWKTTSGSQNDQWRGYDPPRGMSSWQSIFFNSASIAWVSSSFSVVSKEDKLISSVYVHDTSKPAGPYRWESLTRSQQGQWSRNLIESSESEFDGNVVGDLLVLPSGRIHFYRLLNDKSLRLWYSDDDGVTWSSGGDRIASQEIAAKYSRMKTAYSAGQVVMFLGDDANGFAQYASADQGLTFQKVTTVGLGIGRFDVESLDTGGFNLVAIYPRTNDELRSYILSDAFDSFEEVAYNVILSAVTAQIEADKDIVSLTRDGANIMHMLITRTGSLNGIEPWISYDRGDNWITYEDPALFGTWNWDGGGAYPENFDICSFRGRVAMLHNWRVDGSSSSTLSTSASLGVGYLGGWTTHPLPNTWTEKNEVTTIGWEETYFPWEEINTNLNLYDIVTVGAGSQDLIKDANNQNCLQLDNNGTISRISFNRNSTNTIAGTSNVKFTMSLEQGGLSGTTAVAVRVVNNTSSCSIRISQNQARLYDDITGNPIGDGINLPGYHQIVQYWLTFDEGNNVRLFFRFVDSGQDSFTTEDRYWSSTSSTPLNLSTGAPIGYDCIWGHLTTGTNSISNWYEFQRTSTGPTLTGFNSPADLRGRAIAGTPYLGRDTRIKAQSGPAWRGDEWSIPTDYEYSVDNAFNITSPRVTFRSAYDLILSNTFNVNIPFEMSSEAIQPLLGLMIRNTNVRRFDIQVKNGSTYDTWHTIDNWVGPLQNDISNGRITPSASGTFQGYFRHNEFAGATLITTATVDPADYPTYTTFGHRILRNTEGRFNPSASLNAFFDLGTNSTYSPSNIKARASDPNYYIIPRDVLVVVNTHDLFHSGSSPEFQISIPSVFTGSHPAESYWEIGTIKAGWVYPLGTDSSWGRVLTSDVNLQTVTTRDGQKKVKKLSPTARSAQIGWITGIDQTDVESDYADPDFIKATTSATGSASHRGTSQVLDGMFHEIGGAVQDIIYIPRLESGISGTLVLNRKRDFIHGRIANASLQTETVLGDEHVNEVVRTATITIEEEV